jgi:hypothetical protein
MQKNQIYNMTYQFVSNNNIDKIQKFHYLKTAIILHNVIIQYIIKNTFNEKKLLLWLLKQVYIKQINKIKEDSEIIKQNLELYFKNKHEIHKDIHEHDYSELKEWILPYKQSDFLQYQQFLNNPIVQDKDYKIYKITDSKIAAKISKHTSWCVQNENTAKQYLDKGPLYLVTKNNHRYALLHFESAQFMDVDDNELEVKIVKDIFSIWPNSQKMIDVKKDGYFLQYIDEQTKEICLEAVKENGYALQYVKEQTPEICLAAVKQHGWALQYVKEQTPELCLAAVRENGHALCYVKEQTPELCLAAVKQRGWALQFVKEQIYEICLEAVKQDGIALCYVKEQTPEICLEAVKQKNKKHYDVLKIR